MSSAYLEPELSASTRDVHRALSSLQEELEAVDYYHQRAEQTQDAELKRLLEHNREEEAEHAAMLFEWLRRHAPDFDAKMKQYLFARGDLTEVEARVEGGGADRTDPGALGLGSLA